MKRRIKVLASIFLLVAVLLSGCTLKKAGKADKSEPGYGYSMVSAAAPAEMAVVNSQCTDGENIYISGISGGGLPRCYKVLPDSSAKKLKVPGTVEYIYGLCYDGGLYMLCGDKPRSWEDAQGIQQGNEQEEYSLSLILFDSDGSLLDDVVLTGAELRDGVRFFALEKVGDKFFAMSGRRLVCFDSSGQELDNISLNNSQFLTMCCRGNELIVSCFNFDQDSFGCELSVIKVDDKLSITGIYHSTSSIVSGLGITENGEILLANEKGVYFLKEKSGQTEPLAMWSEMGALMPEYSSVIPYKDAYIVSTPGQKSIDIFSYGPLKENRQRLVLLTDTVTPGLKQMVDRFNQKNADYYVVTELFDHNEEGSGDRLRARIASGTGPDIFALYNDSELESLNPEVVYEDIYPYLDADKDYGREDIFTSLLKAMEHRGRLYSMPYDFMIYTFYTTADLSLSSQTTLEDFAEAAESTGQTLFSTWFGRDGIWKWLSTCSLGNFINENDYTCNFVDSGFISILEVCKGIPASAAAPNDDSSLLRLDQVSSLIHVATLGEMFGDNYAFCGCPDGTGGGHCFEVGVRYSMAAGSENKDGSWQFIREVMSPENDMYSFDCLPASVDMFDTMVNLAVTEGLNYPNYLKNPVTISEHDAHRLRNLIEETHFLPEKYPEITQILNEEVQNFFAGDRSAEDTASIIQSRVSIFLSEQYD